MRFVLSIVAILLIQAGPISSMVWAEGRMLTDDTGRVVTLPETINRIVVMHEPLLGLPLMDLGLDLVGSYGRTEDGGFVTKIDFIDIVLGEGRTKPSGIGAVGQIDLEKLRGLRPDLIIGSELDVDKVAQLVQIAPVYLQNVSTGKARGFSVEADLAKVLKREAVFAERLEHYRARLSTVRAKLPDDPNGQQYLAIFLTDQINAVGNMSGMVQVMEDLGFQRPKLTQSDSSGLGSTLTIPLSSEVLGSLNPDLLIVMNSYTSDHRDKVGTQSTLDKIIPGWRHFLKPARDDRIVYVDSAKITTPTVASALHMLDALENWIDNQ